MAEQAIEKSSSEAETKKKKDDLTDPEFFSCVLQPSPANSDADYIGIRRLLLIARLNLVFFDASPLVSTMAPFKEWARLLRSRSYDPFLENRSGSFDESHFVQDRLMPSLFSKDPRHKIRAKDWGKLVTRADSSRRKQHGRWISSPGPLSLSFEMDSWSPIRDLRSGSQALSHGPSFSSKASNASDGDHPRRKAEPRYSFVGMHCIFDQCKAMVTVVKFGQMSSDLLAYGASDGTLTVCTDLRSGSQALSHSPSFSSKASNASDGDHPRRKAEPGYSYVGMHCIFDQCKAMVTVVKFGQMSSDLLAYGASDCTLTVCTVSDPPAVLNQLIGHSKDVTDFDFTLNNQYIASSSMDKTVRIWEISKCLCIRVIYGVSPQLCIRFHLVFNFSTGRVINKTVFDNEVTAMDHDHTGLLIFCGDAQGCVYTVSVNSHTGVLSRSHRNRNGSKLKSPVTTVHVSLEVQGYLTLRCSLKLAPRLHSIRASFCPLLSLEKGEFIGFTGRVINKTVFDNEVTAMDHDHTGELIFCGDAQGCVYTVSMNSHTGVLSRSHRNQNGSERKSPVTTVQVSLEIQGYLTLRCSLKLAPRLHSIRASFCPLLSLEKGEFIVVGSKDANVYFYYLTRPRHACVNKLQGLGYPIIGIAWNHGENLLASSDFGGTVIIWKRTKTGWERIIFGGSETRVQLTLNKEESVFKMVLTHVNMRQSGKAALSPKTYG
ncbi:hypothetical protein TEA_010839 [Camellia sinensis var. sinensis]|uniref:Uncharacterized protein n=1 Tax=Camellia sinensis var. sinensis TaxID=542762 RepID=A0A4S4CYK4_CAMSN|nr:hypothetical protein TEA_010839 [Camellia sinensis var. sinensis]